MKNKFFLLIFAILIISNEVRGLIFGSRVTQGNSRFVASVRLRIADRFWFGSGYLCAGTVINDHNILTTATCVHKFRARHLSVVMGNRNRNIKSDNTVIRHIEQITIHPNFTSGDHMFNNLAILELTQSIRDFSLFMQRDRNSHIHSIRLDTHIPLPGEFCLFIGWGFESPEAYAISANLLFAFMPIQSEKCVTNFKSDTFCAGNVNGGAALCHGNLGGPIVCNNGLLAGIAIDDSGCAQEGTTGYFQTISNYNEWITQVSSAKFSTKINLILIAILSSISHFSKKL